MEMIFKDSDWMYSREELEYMHFDECFRSNTERLIFILDMKILY